jgi:hypothetical protein
VTLSELKPRGYKLSDVEPNFRGMPVNEWLRKMLTSQCDAFLESPKAKAWHAIATEQRWWKKGIQ